MFLNQTNTLASMGLEDFCLERGDEEKLQGKLWMYGQCGKKVYAAYVTDKPETLITETSHILGTERLKEIINLVEDQESDNTGFFFSQMYNLENKVVLLETESDLVRVGTFPSLKDLTQQMISLTEKYSLKYLEQKDRQEEKEYNPKTFMNKYLIPYLDAVTNHLTIEKLRFKQKLFEYGRTTNLPRSVVVDIQKITDVWENNTLEPKIKNSWLGLQLAFIKSCVEAQKDEREYANAARLKRERDHFASKHGI